MFIILINTFLMKGIKAQISWPFTVKKNAIIRKLRPLMGPNRRRFWNDLPTIDFVADLVDNHHLQGNQETELCALMEYIFTSIKFQTST